MQRYKRVDKSLSRGIFFCKKIFLIFDASFRPSTFCIMQKEHHDISFPAEASYNTT